MDPIKFSPIFQQYIHIGLFVETRRILHPSFARFPRTLRAGLVLRRFNYLDLDGLKRKRIHHATEVPGYKVALPARRSRLYVRGENPFRSE